MTFSHPSRWSPTPQSDPGHSPLFAERGWGLDSQPETESQDQPIRASGDLSHLQTQRERAERLGHNFGDIPLFSSTPTVQAQTQPQHTEEQEPESTASEPRLAFAAGSDAPPALGLPEGSLRSIQPRSFLQRNSLPTQQSSQPRISGHADVAAELAQLLQARQEQPSSETLPASSADNQPSSDPSAFVSDFQQALLDNTLARLQSNRSRLESA